MSVRLALPPTSLSVSRDRAMTLWSNARRAILCEASFTSAQAIREPALIVRADRPWAALALRWFPSMRTTLALPSLPLSPLPRTTLCVSMSRPGHRSEASKRRRRRTPPDRVSRAVEKRLALSNLSILSLFAARSDRYTDANYRSSFRSHCCWLRHAESLCQGSYTLSGCRRRWWSVGAGDVRRSVRASGSQRARMVRNRSLVDRKPERYAPAVSGVARRH
jgi:hypothetical protein